MTRWCDNELNKASILLLGNGDINVEGKEINKKYQNLVIKPWTFWPRKPIILEKILKDNGILGYDERQNESIFIVPFRVPRVLLLRRPQQHWQNLLFVFVLIIMFICNIECQLQMSIISWEYKRRV